MKILQAMNQLRIAMVLLKACLTSATWGKAMGNINHLMDFIYMGAQGCITGKGCITGGTAELVVRRLALYNSVPADTCILSCLVKIMLKFAKGNPYVCILQVSGIASFGKFRECTWISKAMLSNLCMLLLQCKLMQVGNVDLLVCPKQVNTDHLKPAIRGFGSLEDSK